MAGDSVGGPVELDRRPSVNTATRRFQNISAILRELCQAGLKLQTVNDLLTVYVGADSQHTLRTTFDPEAESFCFDAEIVACRSQLVGRRHHPTTVSLAASHFRGTATHCSTMDSLAVSHSHSDGDH